MLRWNPTESLLSWRMSVAIGLSSVVPFRLGQYYSDGARFLQHLLRLPFSDLMRIMHIVSAVGETQLRPRDYDIEAIERVRTLYPSGMEGHFLKLYIYDSCFDGGKIAEASQALVEADAIYDSARSRIRRRFRLFWAMQVCAATWMRHAAGGSDGSEKSRSVGVWLLARQMRIGLCRRAAGRCRGGFAPGRRDHR